jgi:hypothetical protein
MILPEFIGLTIAVQTASSTYLSTSPIKWLATSWASSHSPGLSKVIRLTKVVRKGKTMETRATSGAFVCRSKGRLVADLIRGKSGSSAQHPEFHAEKLLESSRRWLSPSPTLNITMARH